MPGPAEPAVNFDSVLDRLRDESLRHFASPRVTMERRRLHVRPFSQVLEVEIETGRRAIGAFVKILKPRAEGPQELEATRRNVAREFEVTSRVHDRFAPHLGLSAPRPIACYPELLALVTERVEGVSLQQLLSRARAFPSKAVLDDLSQTLRRVGAWITAFQAFDGPAGHVSLDEMRSYLDKRLQPLADGHVIDAGVRLGLLRHFDELAARVSESDLEAVPIHADFSPENVLIHNGEVSVLDFTMAKRGPRYLDLSQMFVHLDLLKAKPWFRPAVVESLLTALLAGFDPTLRTDHPLFQLLLLQDVVCHLRQMQLDRPALPARVYSEFLRRRHLAWLMARGAAPVASR
jgi:aminoglycoside phosphotransferase (APT) family kinase protein